MYCSSPVLRMTAAKPLICLSLVAAAGYQPLGAATVNGGVDGELVFL